MKSFMCRVRVGMLAGALLMSFAAFSARAELVTEIGEIGKKELLYQSNTKVSTATTTVASLELDTAGILTVKLKELCDDLFAILSFQLQDENHNVVASKEDGGVWNFYVSAPTTLFASIFADPADGVRFAHYDLRVFFQAIALPNITPVPLPAGIWFLISGLLGVGALAKKKQKLSQIAA